MGSRLQSRRHLLVETAERRAAHAEDDVARADVGDQMLDDGVDLGDEVRPDPRRLEALHDLGQIDAGLGGELVLAPRRREDDLLARGEGHGVGILKNRSARGVALGLEDAPQGGLGVARADGLHGLAHGRRVVGEVVVDHDAIGRGHQFLALAHALESGQAPLNGRERDAQAEEDSHGGQDVVDVVVPHQWAIDLAQDARGAADFEGGAALGVQRRVQGAQLHPTADAKTAHGTRGLARDLAHQGILEVGPDGAVLGHGAHQLLEDGADFLDGGIDVGVIVLDVVDHQDTGLVVPELRHLVEEGRVVLIALDDEDAPRAELGTQAVVVEDAPNEEGGVAPGILQNPGNERSRGGLAVGTADHDPMARLPQKEGPQDLGHAQGRHAQGLRCQHLWVIGTAHVAHDHHIGSRAHPVEILLPPPWQHCDAHGGDGLAHGRVNVLVAAADGEALGLEQASERAHPGTADADQVKVLRRFGQRRHLSSLRCHHGEGPPASAS